MNVLQQEKKLSKSKPAKNLRSTRGQMDFLTIWWLFIAALSPTQDFKHVNLQTGTKQHPVCTLGHAKTITNTLWLRFMLAFFTWTSLPALMRPIKKKYLHSAAVARLTGDVQASTNCITWPLPQNSCLIRQNPLSSPNKYVVVDAFKFTADREDTSTGICISIVFNVTSTLNISQSIPCCPNISISWLAIIIIYLN